MEKIEKTYCVYKHTSPSGKVYIGITSQTPEKRWQNGAGYKNNKYFNNAIQKYGWDSFEHEILFVDLTKEDAAEKEKEFIGLYKSNNPIYGYNISSGGEGGAEGVIISEKERKRRSDHAKTYVGENNPNYGNHKLAGANNPFYGKCHTETTKEKLREKRIGTHHLEETKKKISEATIGENNPRYGKEVKEETKIKISEALKGRQTWMKGKTHTDESKRKISESRKKPVLQFNINGEFIGEYDSPLEAELITGIRRGYIARCCRGESKTVGGFIWRYKNDTNQ